MSKRNTAHAALLSAFALTMLCLLLTAGSAQKGPQSTTGAPLKGVDVKLGKNPGGSQAARTTTDADGHFNFPVVPAGEYTLTLELKQDKPSADSVSPYDPPFRYCLITVNTSGGEKVVKGYDLTENKAFDSTIDPAKQATAKTKFEPFVVHSDGAHPLNGAIVKSKSNITNN